MNYYKKYLKYKNKYLNLKGGKPIEPFTGLIIPEYPEDIDIPIYTEEEINNFFDIFNYPRVDIPVHQYYASIQSPLKENLIVNSINLDNLKRHLILHLDNGEYVNVASLPGDLPSIIWAKKNNGNIQLYNSQIDMQQEPPYSGLKHFLTGFRAARFLFQYQALSRG